jgi:hypothetical protein
MKIRIPICFVRKSYTESHGDSYTDSYTCRRRPLRLGRHPVPPCSRRTQSRCRSQPSWCRMRPTQAGPKQYTTGCSCTVLDTYVFVISLKSWRAEKKYYCQIKAEILKFMLAYFLTFLCLAIGIPSWSKMYLRLQYHIYTSSNVMETSKQFTAIITMK